MKPETPAAAERAAYYADGATWAQDVHGSLRASRSMAWLVALGLGIVAVAEAVALVALMPLKTVVPYTITVDRQTGYVETAAGLLPGKLTQNAAVTQAFLAQYILAREGFDATDLQANYRKVAVWSVGDARARYLRGMAATNPESPLKLYPSTTVLQPIIKSISLISPTSAIVRFDVERRDYGAATGERRSYAAVVGYRYSDAPLRMEDRLLNPLGFQATSYRRDSEMIGSTAASQGMR